MHANDSIQSNEESNGVSSTRSGASRHAGLCGVPQGAFDDTRPRESNAAASSIMDAAAPSILQRIWM